MGLLCRYHMIGETFFDKKLIDTLYTNIEYAGVKVLW